MFRFYIQNRHQARPIQVTIPL